MCGRGKDFRIHSSDIDGSERVMNNGLPSGGGASNRSHTHKRGKHVRNNPAGAGGSSMPVRMTGIHR
jgi:hypothetical protein